MGVEFTDAGEIKERRQTLYFYQDNVAASQSAVALTCLGDAVRIGFAVPWLGSVIGIVVVSNAGRSAGTLTVDATIAGTATGVQAILNATNTTVHYSTQVKHLDTFTAGQLIGVKITTDGTWEPTTADILVGVTVEY